jgi:hypothetical protein
MDFNKVYRVGMVGSKSDFKAFEALLLAKGKKGYIFQI